MDIYGTFYSTLEDWTLFLNSYRASIKIDHIQDHKTSISELKSNPIELN